MGSRGVLTKNYFIYPETVTEYGAEIERVMTETDCAMEEASEIIAKMASVTERIPSQIRSGKLLELCETAQAEIRSFDFLSYGKRVNQGLLNLLDQNQYITDNFIKKMEATTERMREFGAGCRRLTELIDYSGGSQPLKGLALSAVNEAENENTDSNSAGESGPIEYGKNILKYYLENLTDDQGDNVYEEIEINKICTAILNHRPYMYQQLYITSCYSSYTAQNVIDAIMKYYNSHYFGRYPYPVEYIEGIIMAYETHKIEEGRFVLDNGGATIVYGHDVLPGEDYSEGLSMEEGLELAIEDLNVKYDTLLRYIDVLNSSYGKDIHIENFTEDEVMFLLDFLYNRGEGLVERDKDSGEPYSSIALLIIAVSEDDQDSIINILKEEVNNNNGEYLKGLELRRMDEYEILTMGNYERSEDIERGVW